MWEFDSIIEYTYKGNLLRKQVWSRQSKVWLKEKDWCIRLDTGKENPPPPNYGHWTSLESFRKTFPHFRES